MKTLLDKFIEKAIKIHDNKYDYSLVKYINNRTRIKIICPIHGVFEQTPDKHINSKRGCQVCGGTKKLTTEEFIKKSKKIYGNIYDYSLTEYINANTKVKIIYNGEVFEQVAQSHLNGYNSSVKKINEDLKEKFIKKSNIIHNNKYDYSLVKYKNTTHSQVKIICHIHGEFEQFPISHLNGVGCVKCKNQENFIKKSNKLYKKYDYSLVKYVDNYTKIKIICPIHGVFEQTPKNHYRNGCPTCSKSKGEKEIKNILKNNNITYIQQKKFKECKNIRVLPFDFYLPEHNMCIEYDGLQHFKSIDYWGGEKTFKKVNLRDKIKNNYCEENNIKLVRIRYDENIANKMDDLISSF